MPKTIGLTVVTIIAPAEFAYRLEEDLLRLGAGGYTMSEVSGQGQRRPSAGCQWRSGCRFTLPSCRRSLSCARGCR